MSNKNPVCHLPWRMAANTDHVWIGEDLLDSTLRQFVNKRQWIRNSSSVPGPLEARKRAAKRRMVNVAPAAGSAAIDPTLLLGMGKESQTGNWQWQKWTQPNENNYEGLRRLRCLALYEEANQGQGNHFYPHGLRDLHPAHLRYSQSNPILLKPRPNQKEIPRKSPS